MDRPNTSINDSLQSTEIVPAVISVAAPAKINLYFDILNKREDGYHEILTLFQALDLQDKLTFTFTKANHLRVVGNKSYDIDIFLKKKDKAIREELFPLNDDNSIAKAINIFLSSLSYKPLVKIKVEIEKNIPIGAGLAGGSTDGAASLFALNHYFNKPFLPEELLKMASLIGSDVSFCLSGGLAIGRGRGEYLEDLDVSPKYHFVHLGLIESTISLWYLQIQINCHHILSPIYY
jgi:4-diphosphocytidyl-2-C-methyl-D-erythritol kinase